jgi:DNA-directed RNA polymerase subunit L
VRFCFGRLYDVEEVENFTIKVKDTLLRLFEHYMNVDENVEVVHSVGTSINENVNVDLMVVNDDMLDDLASQFKKHLEEKDGVKKKMRLRGIWVMIVRILMILN